MAQTVDPCAGSYAIEAVTDEIENRATAVFAEIAALGGMLRAIERGYMQQEIQNAAYESRAVDADEAIVVGVNRFTRENRAGRPLRAGSELVSGAQAG